MFHQTKNFGAWPGLILAPTYNQRLSISFEKYSRVSVGLCMSSGPNSVIVFPSTPHAPNSKARVVSATYHPSRDYSGPALRHGPTVAMFQKSRRPAISHQNEPPGRRNADD